MPPKRLTEEWMRQIAERTMPPKRLTEEWMRRIAERAVPMSDSASDMVCVAFPVCSFL